MDLGTKTAIDTVKSESLKSHSSSYGLDVFNTKNDIGRPPLYDEYISKSINDFLYERSESLFDIEYFKSVYDDTEINNIISFCAGIEIKKNENSVSINFERLSDRTYIMYGQEFYYTSTLQISASNDGDIKAIKSKDFFEYYPYNKEKFEALFEYLSKTMKYCNENNRNM